jgi:hypothetical protein
MTHSHHEVSNLFRSTVSTFTPKPGQSPEAIGKHTPTKGYTLFLAQWARKRSWKETAQYFRTSWEEDCQGGGVGGRLGPDLSRTRDHPRFGRR